MTKTHAAALKTNPHAINWSLWIGGVLFAIALVFVYRSFYGMRIPEDK